MKQPYARYFVGDLHARPWPAFSTTAEGRNAYLEALERFIGEVLPSIILDRCAAQGFSLGDVVFLGDLGDEPYLRGKVTIAAAQALRSGFEKLRKRIPERRAIAGNHDMVSSGGSWLGMLEDVVTIHERAEVIHTEGLRPLALVPYYADQTELFQAVAAMPEDALLAGHFVYDGARYDNGEEWAKEACVPKSQASRFWGSVLGHAHIPRDEPGIVYAGVPLPYSWAMAGVRGSIVEVVESGDEPFKFNRIAVPGPVFLGPLTPQELRKQKQLVANSFVRLRVPQGDNAAAERVREEFPGLHFAVEYEAPKQGQATPRLDLSALESTGGRATQKAGLGAYIDYVAKNEELPIPADELLALGVEFLGGESE